MRLSAASYPYSLVIYGERELALSLCDQLASVDIAPLGLYCDGDGAAYGNIPQYPRVAIAQLAGRDDIRIIPATESFWEARKEIEAIDASLLPLTLRDLAVLGDVVRHAQIIDPPPLRQNPQPLTFLSLQLGLVLGGLETWVTDLYHDLKAEGVDVKLLEPLQANPYHYVGPEFYRVDPGDVIKIGPYAHFMDHVRRLIELLCEYGPTTYIDNGSYRLMAAVYLAKKQLGLPIRVISVLHGDIGIVYDRIGLFHTQIDKFFAVSDAIAQKLGDMLPDRKADIRVKLKCTPPQYDSMACKPADGPLQIAFASRLDPSNKRCMWLADMARALDARGIDFSLHIAGEGPCYAPLDQFIKSEGFEDRIRLYGQIDRAKMEDFWRDKHAFVNFSISEGGPLTLFESMGHGLVPVVTEAGSARRLIAEGANGFIIESPDEAADRLAILASDRARLRAMGAAALNAIGDYIRTEGTFVSDFA